MQPSEAWELRSQEVYRRFVALSLPINRPRTAGLSTVDANPVIAGPRLLRARTRVRRRRRKRSRRAPSTYLLPMPLVSSSSQTRGRSEGGRTLWHLPPELISNHRAGPRRGNAEVACGATVNSTQRVHIIACATFVGRSSLLRHRQ
jgi:hypothetical protein